MIELHDFEKWVQIKNAAVVVAYYAVPTFLVLLVWVLLRVPPMKDPCDKTNERKTTEPAGPPATGKAHRDKRQ